MGPKTLHLGPEVPEEEFIWQDPVPQANYTQIEAGDIEMLKEKIENSGLSTSELVSTAWASASTFRESDYKGGANGARIRLEPQINWEVNQPKQLKKVLSSYAEIQKEFQASAGKKQVSMADLIVLGGNVGIERAAQASGYAIEVPFTPGRTDATQEQTDVESIGVLEPEADGFRNYLKTNYTVSTEALLVDKAQLLTLTVPEMTVLVGGMRALDANYDGSDHGILTERPGQLTNDFFVNLLDMKYQWSPADESQELFVGKDRNTGEEKWTATRVDLIFGSHSELRAIAEVYGSGDAEEKFVRDFVNAWTKVMELDRYDLQ